MALSALDIYKLLPKTNCKECGSATCLAFAMLLSQKKASLDQCPYVSESAKSKLDASAQPPIKLVTIGIGDKKIEIGNETVLFRHDESFYHPPAITISIRDNDNTILEKVKQINALDFERVGQKIAVKMIAVDCASNDASVFANAVGTVANNTQLALMLICKSPQILSQAIFLIADKKPLIYAANRDNLEEMGNLAKQYKLPLVVQSDSWDTMAEQTQKLQALGVDELVLDTTESSFSSTLQKLTQGRRLALRRNFRPLGYPMLVLAQNADPYQEAAQASTYVCKYASVIVIEGSEPWEVLPILTTIQNIYTDPRKPTQVEPKLYSVGAVTPESPLLLTTNFSLTYYTVEGEVEASRVPAYILVADTEGTSVLTAYAAEKLTADSVVDIMKKSQVDSLLSHRKLVIPGYIAVMSGKLEEKSGYSILVGPREASGIPKYLKVVWPTVAKE